MSLPDFLRPKVSDASVDHQYKLKALLLIGSILVSSIVVTNIIGVKIMTLFGLNFTAGVVTYGLVFLCTDVIGEIWGKRTGYYFVLLGFICSLFMLLFVHLAIVSSPAVFWSENQAAYEQTLGGVGRIVFASMIAYLISQLHDVWAFDFWRRCTKARWLFLRNNLSTITSQTIDTVLFIGIAFGGVFSMSQIVSMVLGQIVIKWGIAVVDTPAIYLVLSWIGPPVKDAHPTYD